MTTTRERLAAILPAFALEVRTPRLTLRFPDDEDVLALAELGRTGVHPPDQMPFTTEWTRVDSPFRERNTVEFLWTQRCTLQTDAWHLSLAVVVDGRVVGVQALLSIDWHKTRTIETGSWLGSAFQGQGIGTEMRLAALHLGFDGFGAWQATTAAFADNPSSLGVTRTLGYRPAGTSHELRDGVRRRLERFTMEPEDFATLRRDDVELVGAEPVLELFGSKRDPAAPVS